MSNDKPIEILRAIAKMAADGKQITFSHDWGFGTATVELAGGHTHIGGDFRDSDDENLRQFIDDLHNLLVHGLGLSLA